MSPTVPFSSTQTLSDDETDSSTDGNSDIFSDRSDDNNTDDEILLFGDKEEYPSEYYLAKSASLDASRLRQQGYSPKTQE
jgi:hypothetical protein